MKRSLPRGMTLLEVLIALSVLAITSILSVKAVQSLTSYRESVQRNASYDRRYLIIMAQLENDLRTTVRSFSAPQEGRLAIREQSLILPFAVWNWGLEGLSRRDLLNGNTTQYLSAPVLLGFSMYSQEALLAETLQPDARIPLRELVALQVSISLVDRAGQSGGSGLSKMIDMRTDPY